ncbi:GntR family transcriptional regulator [Labrys wisconsinensis]|uniref:DNA-binding GntR family transcriptional regulator n=1 Tax=Labrys wisconsinensis TaxID=425677 RepID=A0ABU0J9X3_9HYPH|nr:GntR family transcriptional regulator [Labrys wisconsinensis]MDQ0471052.1 DNA-binding GntR family transcriptional regulator [Labrys wisconsinensis]
MDNHLLRDPGKSDHVYSALKRLVTNGRFRPGEKLGIRKLADDLGVSTTPVREGLIRLALEEFILTFPSEGFFTKPFDVEEAKADLELVFMIEKYGIEANIAHFTLDGLRNPLNEISGDPGNDISKLVLFLEQLTRRLSGLSGNEKATRVADRTNERLHYIRLVELERPANRHEILTSTGQLIEQLLKRCSDEAVALLHHALERQVRCLPEIVNEANGRALKASPQVA